MTVCYTVDGQPYTSMLPVVSGAFVKAKVGGLDPSYGLLLVREDGEAYQIRDHQRVALHGRAFTTYPQATGG